MEETKPKKKTEAYIRAQVKHDAKRPAPVTARYNQAELELLDRRRGKESRGVYMKRMSLFGVDSKENK